MERPDGSFFYTNQRPTNTKSHEMVVEQRGKYVGKPGELSRFPTEWQQKSASRYIPSIESLCREHGVEPLLVLAMVQVESAFNPNAVSPKGAQGLMQLMPATAKRFGVKDSFDPEQNLDGGIQYMSYLLGLFQGDLQLSLAAYNSGENRVLRVGRIPNIRETKQYVRRVMNLYSGSRGTRTASLSISGNKPAITRGGSHSPIRTAFAR